MNISKILSAGLICISVLNATPTDETVTLKGKTVKLSGNKINVGDTAPEVTLVTSDLKEVVVGGKTSVTQVLVVVPSIDTPICDMEARSFNETAANLKNVQITVISMDLPFAGKRYCAAHGIKNITVASDFQTKSFGNAYGTLMGDGILKGVEARVIFIIKNGKVTYKQVVPEISTAPDFKSVLDAI
ncbi:thiol peroxidase [Sulfurimonas sp. SAG-AH-194-L11]|nr:thiol peroxidase [Sulfurimonas sp. SAG-AH-194-L11]MDF1877088.1 thiol peroxidase [Sulfurimonas sp. SAG-AH-194-L11]